jgi:hypothetical protein
MERRLGSIPHPQKGGRRSRLVAFSPRLRSSTLPRRTACRPFTRPRSSWKLVASCRTAPTCRVCSGEAPRTCTDLCKARNLPSWRSSGCRCPAYKRTAIATPAQGNAPSCPSGGSGFVFVLGKLSLVTSGLNFTQTTGLNLRPGSRRARSNER